MLLLTKERMVLESKLARKDVALSDKLFKKAQAAASKSAKAADKDVAEVDSEERPQGEVSAINTVDDLNLLK